jgi:hypothetical protein
MATQSRNFMLKESAAYLGLLNNQSHREGVRAPKKKHVLPPLHNKGRATKIFTPNRKD